MANSKYVNATYLSPNHYSSINKIVGVTVHCVVGYMSMASAGDWFGKSSTNASCNYYIDKDGNVALIVPETQGSWCSSNQANDMSHLTIECACDPNSPYTFPDATYKKLVLLVADIYQRHNISKATWTGDTSGNITAHYFFKNKACPGDWFKAKLNSGEFCKLVNAELNGVQPASDPVNSLGLKYTAHCQTYGWLPEVHDGQIAGTVGKSKRLEAFKIDASAISGLKLHVKAHIQGIGWKDFGVITPDTIIGTVGQSKRIEAIQIEAEGLPTGKNLCYSVQIETFGWLGFIPAPYTAGTVGIGKRIEAIKIQIA